MRLTLIPVCLLLAMPLTGCGGGDTKASPKDAITAGCHAFTAVAHTRDARRATAQTALAAARSALVNGTTPAALQALATAEAAATKAEVEYARTPDVALVAVAFAAEADATYQPVLQAFLSGDIPKAIAACSPY